MSETQASFALRGRNPDVLTCIANLSNDEVVRRICGCVSSNRIESRKPTETQIVSNRARGYVIPPQAADARHSPPFGYTRQLRRLTLDECERRR